VLPHGNDDGEGEDGVYEASPPMENNATDRTERDDKDQDQGVGLIDNNVDESPERRPRLILPKLHCASKMHISCMVGPPSFFIDLVGPPSIFIDLVGPPSKFLD
jgi:hypothetical protein